MPELVRTTFNLPKDELEQLRQLARRRLTSITHALRQAIQTELFVQRLLEQGGTLLVQLPNGDLQQLVFGQMGTDRAPGRKRGLRRRRAPTGAAV
jgi:hypothetical protein